jgi:hypothetical protein
VVQLIGAGHSLRDGEVYSEDERLVFFHYSGYDAARPDKLTRFDARGLSSDNEAVVCKLLEDYAGKLSSALERAEGVEPDMPCMEAPFKKRIKNYDKVTGERVGFFDEFKRARLLWKLKSGIASVLGTEV